MNLIEAKKILLAADFDPLVREALNVLSPDLDFQNLSGEEWRDLINEDVDFKDDYQVSNFGRVRNFKLGTVTICKQYINNKGYPYVDFRKNGKRKHRCVHILVAKAFIPNPENKPEVNHIDGDKNNICVTNLEWVTHSENIQHSYDAGLRKSGCENGHAKLTPEQIREIRRDCVPGDPELGFKSFARKFNVSFGVIRKVFYRETYRNVE